MAVSVPNKLHAATTSPHLLDAGHVLRTQDSSKINDSLHSANLTLDDGVKVLFPSGREG